MQIAVQLYFGFESILFSNRMYREIYCVEGHHHCKLSGDRNAETARDIIDLATDLY